MNAIRTIKLKITGTTKADTVIVAWLRAANWLSEIVFKTHEVNSNRLHRMYYAQVREMGLPSQATCSLFRTVGSTYKTAKANKRWKLATFKRPNMPIIVRRDFSQAKRGVTLWGELLTFHDPRPLPTGKWKDSRIKRVGTQWYLILTHEVEIPEPKPAGCIVGVDVGVKRMIVATNSYNSKTFFFRGGELNHRRCCLRRTRASVQSVGTRSSKRLLKRLSGHETAVTGHLLHVASKALIRYAVEVGARRIVLERLTNIRDACLEKGRSFREKILRWPYADLQFKIGYKAETQGISVEHVSPRNTSRGCHLCGHVATSNRRGLIFRCGKCGHTEDADRHASRNIRARSVSVEHNSAETGSRNAPLSWALGGTPQATAESGLVA